MPRPMRNIANEKFGRLRVIKDSGKRLKSRNIIWECKCECGNITNVSSNDLLKGSILSCGCYFRDLSSANNRNDLTNKKFGNLAIINDSGKRKNGNIIWRCECECGNITEHRGSDLLRGNVRSCGCLLKKTMTERSGINHPNWKGGISCEPYCEQWQDKEYKESIKERDNHQCLNPECSRTVDKLCIHHIDYNKKNCHPLNLITVCASCNSKANKDRKWHKAWYQAIINKRYND